jgi:three-Cys-motif partner protein
VVCDDREQRPRAGLTARGRLRVRCGPVPARQWQLFRALGLAFVPHVFSKGIMQSRQREGSKSFSQSLQVVSAPEPTANEAGEMADEDFFTERADQSEVKARIVSKYFPSWARIIAPRRTDRKVAYIDLFAGPGRYEDGSASTPLMVLSEALKIPELRDGLVSIFNDYDEDHTRTLETEIAKLPDIALLKHKPQVNTGQIDRDVGTYFESVKLIPAFSFIDPFGYKGLSWALVHGVIKDWASECVFFFNYSRINAGVSNELVFTHMEALFGKENFEALRERLKSSSVNREAAIMEHLIKAMTDAGAKFVLPFRFRDAAGNRTTHYLIFVTKHQIGYEIMKEIMAVESSYSDQGVPSLEYSPAMAGVTKLFETALDDLEDQLTVHFASKTCSMVDIYHDHNPRTRYIKRNYKSALGNLETAKRVTTNKPNRKAGTFADDVLVTFPTEPIPRS